MSRMELVHNVFEVRYGWDLSTQQFAKLAHASFAGSNHSGNVIVSRLVEKCTDSYARYGALAPLTVNAYAIQDRSTAETLLQRLVDYFWAQHLLVTFDTPFVGIHLEVGDYVTMTHPDFPANDTGQLFEIVRVTYIPEIPDSRPWPIRIMAMRISLPTFTYVGVKDQEGVVWFWWLTPGRDIAWSLTPPSTATRTAKNVGISPIPSWFALVGPGGIPYYLYAATGSGGLLVDEGPPPLGTGYATSPVLRAMSQGDWKFTVTSGRDVLVVPA